MIRITNKQMSQYTTARVEFHNAKSTAFARFMHGDLYVVYSYGLHFPMYVHDPQVNRWFGNSDKYSTTTSRHQTQARPKVPTGGIEWLDTDTLKELILSNGYVGMVTRRLGGRRLTDMPGHAVGTED